MRRLCVALLFVFLSSAPDAIAQEGELPVFGGAREAKGKSQEKNPTDKSKRKPAPQRSADEQLVDRLAAWPSPSATEAARLLVLKGDRVTKLVMRELKNVDWRIRCGCAYVLGELREQAAFPILQRSVRDIANRISLGPYFDAMTKIDPIAATAEILPFVSGQDVRAAKAAMAALPEVIDQKFESAIVDMTRSRDNEVRFRAVSLLPRLRNSVPSSAYVQLLGDRAPRVANRAAEILADSLDDETAKVLSETMLNGTHRSACYAILTLVKAEDLTNRIFLNEDASTMKRLRLFLRIKGDFENAAAAIALANMSMRSTDEKLRQFADSALMEYLLHPAGTGRIFHDYISVKDVLLDKAALVSGESFGRNAKLWVDWWLKNRDGFRARRELTSLSEGDATKLLVRYARRAADEVIHLAFVAGEPRKDDVRVSRPFYVAAQDISALIRLMNQLEVMKDRGMRPDPSWAGDFVELTLDRDAAQFKRAHYGEVPDALRSLEEELTRLSSSNRWQLFWNRSHGVSFGEWFQARRTKFKGLSADQHASAVAEEGLSMFATLDRRGRREATRAMESAGIPWIQRNMARIRSLLNRETLRIEASIEILPVLAKIGGNESIQALVNYLPLFKDEGTQILDRYLAMRPLSEVFAFDDGGRSETRAALIPHLVKRIDEDERVLKRLIDFGAEPDSVVHDALVRSFRSHPHANANRAIEQRIQSASPQNRLNLLELYGAIGGDEAADYLKGAYERGGQAERDAVILALRKSQSNRAVLGLIDIVKTSDRVADRAQALNALTAIGNDQVREAVRAYIKEPMPPARLLESMPACLRLFRNSLDADFVPFLNHKEPGIRREAALSLGSLGIKSAVPELLNLLLDEVDSNRAWESLELITCHEVVTPGGEEALAAYREWWKKHEAEDQHDWFMAVLSEEELPSRHLLGFLEGKDRPFRAISLLIRALESKRWFVRVNAHNYLTRIRGAELGDLNRRSTPAEVAKMKTRWTEWYNALLEGY